MLACDAKNSGAVLALRERKYRKEKPFALMVKELEVARELVQLSPEAEQALTSVARPIVLAPARVELPAVAPDCDELGVCSRTRRFITCSSQPGRPRCW